MSFLGRVMNAVRYGYYGARQGWSAGYEAAPSEYSGWDTTANRKARYDYYQQLYNNSVYSDTSPIAAYLKGRGGYYQHIRGIRMPAARLVDLYTAKVYPGMIDWVSGKDGAIPLIADDPVRAAILLTWEASNWGENKDVYVANGAKLGDSCLMLVDTGDYVCMEVVDPAKVVEIDRDKKGHITRFVLEYDVVDDNQRNRTYCYRLEGDLEAFATYKNGEPFDYAGDGKTKWDNPYGFCPILMKPHKQTGLDFGMNAFHTSIAKIHELNDAASLLNDNIRKHVNIHWAAIGVDPPPSNPTHRGAETQRNQNGMTTIQKDGVPITYVPSDTAKFQALVADINIEMALKNLEAQERELENDMPELSLHSIRMYANASGITIENAYSDAISRITSAMGNYDSGLCLAQSMAIAMAAHHGYKGFERFSLEDYHNGNLKHSISEREIFDHTLKATDKLQIYPTLKDQPPAVARRMLEVMREDPDTIDDMIKALGEWQEEKQQREDEKAARSFLSSMYDDNDDDSVENRQGENLKLSTQTKKLEMDKLAGVGGEK